MKTTDLIPILLYELKTGDKYGLEIVESIKSASNDQIEIKQPTLYPLLKKLEKSKFISSYWQDSEIGGKRHYYKITSNGLAQLDTYPPLEDLIENALKDEESFDIHDTDVEPEIEKRTINTFNNSPSPFDNIFNDKTQGIDNINTKHTISRNELQSSNTVEVENISPFDNKKLFDFDTEKNIENDRKDIVSPFDNINEINDNNDKIDDKNENNENANNIVDNDDLVSVEEDISSQVASDISDFNDKNDVVLPNSNQEEQQSLENDSINQNITNNIDNNATISTPTADSKNTLDIFEALAFADEEDNDNIVESKNANTTTNKVEESAKSTTNDNLVLENPFFKYNAEKSLNEKSNLEINQENAKLISNNADSEKFASEKSVKRFTEKPILPATDFVKDKTKNLFVESATPITPKLNTVASDVEFRDYIDYKNNEQIVKSKKSAKLKLIKILTSSGITMVFLSFLLALCIKNTITPLFVLVFISTTLYVVLYSCRFTGEYKTIRLQIDSANKTYNFKRQILIRAICFVGIVVVLTIVNFVGLKNGKLFSINNFGNYLAPILLSLMLFTDYLLSYIFYKLLKK